MNVTFRKGEDFDLTGGWDVYLGRTLIGYVRRDDEATYMKWEAKLLVSGAGGEHYQRLGPYETRRDAGARILREYRVLRLKAPGRLP